MIDAGNGLSDEQLMALYQETKGENYFAELYSRMDPRIRKSISGRFRLRHSVMDEIMAATWGDVVRYHAQFNCRKTLYPWIWKIAYRNVLRDRREKRKRREVALDRDIMARPGTEDIAEKVQTVLELVERLPKNEQEVLREWVARKSSRTVAESLQVPRGTVRDRLLRARRRLRSMLERQATIGILWLSSLCLGSLA